MIKNKILIPSIFIISFFVIYKVFSNTDKEEISNIIIEIEESLEYKKALQPLAVISRLKTVKSHLAKNFSAKYVGNTQVRELENNNSIKNKAMIAARYFPRIDIFKLPSLIEIKDMNASTSFKITISGQDMQGVKFKELFDIVMKFEKLEGRWFCSSIIASRLTPEDTES